MAFDAQLAREEIRALFPDARAAWMRGLLLHAVIWGLFAVAVPWQKGLDFFDPLILLAYASLGGVFAIPIACGGGQTSRWERVLGRIMGALAYGEFMALGMLLTGVGVVYLTHLSRAFFPPAWGDLLLAVVFGAGLTLVLVLVSIWLMLRFSPLAAQRLMRVVLFGLLIAFFYRGRALEASLLSASASLWAASAALLLLVRRAV